MTAIQPYVRVRDLTSDLLVQVPLDGGGTVTAETSTILSWFFEPTVDAAAKCHLEVLAADPVGIAMIDAAGGANGIGPLMAYQLEFGLAGPTGPILWRKQVETPEHGIKPEGPTIIEEGDDAFIIYSVTGIDRILFSFGPQPASGHAGVAPSIALYALPGTIPQPPGTLAASGYFSFQKGIYRTIPGNSSWTNAVNRVAFQPVVDPVIDNLGLAGMDMNSDYIDKASQTFVNRVCGYFIPGDYAPYTSRGHFLSDSGDLPYSLYTTQYLADPGSYGTPNLQGTAATDRTITFGFVGKFPYLTFDFENIEADSHNANVPIISDITLKPTMDSLYRQASFVGGTSDTNLPIGANVIKGVTTNWQHAASATDWWNSLICYAISGTAIGNSGGAGGVYFDPHDGFLHLVGAAVVGVNDLAYDFTTNTLYAATDYGVFSHSADHATIDDNQPWAQVGSLRMQCKKIICLTGGVLLVLVKGSGSTFDGIYTFGAGSGSGTSTNLGYGGWNRAVQSSDILDFACTSISDIYYVTNNQSAYVSHNGVKFITPDGSAITALNTINGGTAVSLVAVLTAAGSAGLYGILPGANAMASIVSGGFVDYTGTPVLVSQVVAVPGGMTSINNVPSVCLLAATSAGVFWCNSATGGLWGPVSEQSGVADASLLWVCTGVTCTVLGRPMVRMSFGDTGTLFVSNSGGVYALDLLQASLDGGPAWMALARICNAALGGGNSFVDNTVGYLGVLAGFTPDGGVSIAGLPIPATNALALPINWTIERRLTELNDFTYRMVNYGFTGPNAGIMFGSLTEIQSNALVGSITASQQLYLIMFRFLGQSQYPTTTIEVKSAFSDTDSLLLTCRPLMMVNLNYVGTVINAAKNMTTHYAEFVNQGFYVQTYRMTGDTNPNVLVEATISNVLNQQKPDPTQMQRDLSYSIKNIQRFGVPH